MSIWCPVVRRYYFLDKMVLGRYSLKAIINIILLSVVSVHIHVDGITSSARYKGGFAFYRED